MMNLYCFLVCDGRSDSVVIIQILCSYSHFVRALPKSESKKANKQIAFIHSASSTGNECDREQQPTRPSLHMPSPLSVGNA